MSDWILAMSSHSLISAVTLARTSHNRNNSLISYKYTTHAVINWNYLFKWESKWETQEVLKWLRVELSVKLANMDVLAVPCVAMLRSVFPSPLRAHRASTPARSTAAFSQGLRSLHSLPSPSLPSFLPLSFLFSCQDCNQAFSLWPGPTPPCPKSHQQTKLWEKWRAETEGVEWGVRDSH